MKYLAQILILTLIFLSCENKEIDLKNQQIAQLKDQIDIMKSTNAGLLDRMSDLSVVSKTGAESIQKSLENISRQTAYIEDLNKKVQSKDSVNLSLVMNLKRSLSDINDSDIQVEVRGGLVHVSISDKLLFKSGSSTINADAKLVLGKIAQVINDHYELQILVEGHTDNVPMNTSCIADNWDLSVMRATAVVRSLADDHYVSPERLTAAGRSYYIPKNDNDTVEGRSKNRRTEIIIQPRLDQFFQLLETSEPLD
ncbi:MAG: OmpA family protein [Saprospiraceae bacterium]|nr:OmpA family protein [Saprospiraceae bacterium]